jgi:hypothetical protein
MRRLIPLCALLGACAPSPDPTPPVPVNGTARQVVPDPGLPDGYQQVAGPSNNNLDVVRHDGRVYLAVRNAPTHFASDQVRLFVFSSADETTWQLETLFFLATDLREPRFLSLKGRLFLYFAKLGANLAAFEPQGMLMSERQAGGTWTAPVGFYKPNEKFIPWRIVVDGGRAYMTAYNNGQRIYDFSGLPIDIELLVSDDGVSWAPVDPLRPVVSTGGGSETAFAFDSKGDLYAVIRNERGDETGYGSKICYAPAADLAYWRCNHDPKKYDSPLLFVQDDTVYLVGRRNLTPSGNYELYPEEPYSLTQTAVYLADYSANPKRCAIWQVERSGLTVRYLADVPGWGDTCFPSVIDDPGSPRRRILYNYSSPLDGPDLNWMDAQHGETRIYRSLLDLQ